MKKLFFVQSLEGAIHPLDEEYLKTYIDIMHTATLEAPYKDIQLSKEDDNVRVTLAGRDVGNIINPEFVKYIRQVSPDTYMGKKFPNIPIASMREIKRAIRSNTVVEVIGTYCMYCTIAAIEC